jgi:hypothetical protein
MGGEFTTFENSLITHLSLLNNSQDIIMMNKLFLVYHMNKTLGKY